MNNKFIQTKDVVVNFNTSQESNDKATLYHTHKTHFEIILYISGNTDYLVDDKVYHLKKYDLIFTRPGKTHALKHLTPSTYQRYNISFDTEILSDVNPLKIVGDTDVINVARNEIILDIFKRLDYYCSQFYISDFIEITTCLLKELFFNLKIFKKVYPEDTSKLSNLLQDAISIINNNLYTLKSVSEISDKLYVSETYLYKIFKTELNVSPKKYINEKRILAANNMILLGKKPTEACFACGFNEYTSFYKSYIKFFGYAPSNKDS